MEDNDFFGIAIVDYCTVVADTPFNCDAVPPIGGDSKPDRIRVVNNGAIGNEPRAAVIRSDPRGGSHRARCGFDSCASNNAGAEDGPSCRPAEGGRRASTRTGPLYS